jgi:phosphatidate cytidylyltransferase
MLEPAFATPSIALAVTTCYRMLAIFTLAGALIWGRGTSKQNSEAIALKKRFFTYAVITVLTFGSAYLGGLFFIAFVAFLALGCVQELFTIVNPHRSSAYRYLAFAVCALELGAAASISTWCIKSHNVPVFYLIPSLVVTLAACTPVLLQNHKQILSNMYCTVFGAVYFGWLLSHLLLIRSLPNGFGLIVYLFMCVACNDILAYAVGRSLGRHKMSPVISPGKTWEGFWGGAAGTMIAALVFHYAVSNISISTIVSLALLTIVAAPLGDLIISVIKREFCTKDSGSLLPGHGGLLDRFDSLVLTVPAFYYMLTLAG